MGNQPFVLRESRCGFPIGIAVVSDREYVIHDTLLADGTEIQRITGELVLSFTNTTTGATVIENVSGPSMSTFAPDGSGSFQGQGRSWLSFGPKGQANTGSRASYSPTEASPLASAGTSPGASRSRAPRSTGAHSLPDDAQLWVWGPICDRQASAQRGARWNTIRSWALERGGTCGTNSDRRLACCSRCDLVSGDGRARPCAGGVRRRLLDQCSRAPLSGRQHGAHPGTETSGGETGSIACTGTFDGQRVTGSGTFGYEGSFTGITCLFDSAPLSGRYSFTVPTDAGSLHFTGTITDARIAIIDRFELSQSGAHLTGTAAVVPINGTCLITPTTDILITIVGSFRPALAGTPAVPNPTVTGPSAAVPTQVLGPTMHRQPSLPVTGPTNLGFVGVLAMLCYLLAGIAFSSSRKHRRRALYGPDQRVRS